MKTRHGFTIAELMVAMLLLAIIGVLIMFTLRNVIAQTEHGTQRLEMQQEVREAQRRVQLLLRSGVPPNAVQASLYLPDLGTSSDEVVFCSTPELMDPAQTFDPRNPAYELFRIYRDTGQDNLVLESVYGTASPRILGRDISDFEVERLSDVALSVRVQAQRRVRGATGQYRTENHEVKTSLHLPAQ